MSYQVTTFYRFTPLTNLEDKQQRWLAYCQQARVNGTILMATEGINATIAGDASRVAAVIKFLETELGSGPLSCRHAACEQRPFQRLKVKIKPEIVTFGHPEVDPNQQTGTYVDPHGWNQILQDPDIVVIDTRNHHEVAIGQFQAATNPQTANFRQFSDFVDHQLDPRQTPKVAMYCTGGIRCEKASSYLLQQGFDVVYHLKGGILNYLETIPPEQSLWQGECFVFDERVAVKTGLAEGSYEICACCGYPLSPEERRSPLYVADQHCPHCDVPPATSPPKQP